MVVIDYIQLENRVDVLRKKGVSFPYSYPPANLDPSSEWFRSILGEVETVELLTTVVDASIVEVNPPLKGDVDIAVHTNPSSHLMQVKDFVLSSVRSAQNEPVELERVIAAAINSTEADISSKAPDWSTFTKIRIHRDNHGELVYSGESVAVTKSKVTRLWLVETDPTILESTLKTKLERRIDDAFNQLVENREGILVPVLNMRRYPHNQGSAYKHVKALFQSHDNWSDLGGILMITNDFVKEPNATGFHNIRARFIGVENPLCSEARRLDPLKFNPDLPEEDIHEEWEAILRIKPEGTLFSVRNGAIYVEEVKFGDIPHNYSNPTAVRLFPKLIEDSP